MTESLGKRSDDIAQRSIQLGDTAKLLDQAEVAVTVLTGDAVIVYTNTSFARACGRPVPELHGEELTKWTIEDDTASLTAIIADLAEAPPKAEAVRTTEARIVGADGRVRPLRLHLGPLTGGDDRLLLCLAQDRSDDRRRQRDHRSELIAEAAASSTDPETGIANREGLEEALRSASRRSRNNHSPHALMRCELTIDDDNTGDVADEPDSTAIGSCVDRIRQRLRPADTVGRLDKSVLAVVAEDLHDEQDAAGVAYRLLSTVVEPVPSERGPVGLRMVIGLVMADGTTPPNALISASAEAAADARTPGGFVRMDLRGIEG